MANEPGDIITWPDFKDLSQDHGGDVPSGSSRFGGLLFPWATDVAANFGIPRLCFHGTGVFALSVLHGLRQHKPYKTITSDFEPFTVPGLPDQVKITRQQLPSFIKEEAENKVRSTLDQCIKSEMSSYGVLVNSFHELEPGYSEHYRKVIGKKTWYIGPVSLCNRDTSDKAQQGHECLRWLDSKQPNSVIYICFGSLMHFWAAKQLFEIAMALEATGQNFIWVVKKEDKDKEEWLPEGFETWVDGRGLIIRGWAPQVLILDHEAIGGFMTHCGWNSILESVTAGVPMVTWPLSAEQFYNEKLVTDVLKIGVGVGAQESSSLLEEKKNIVKRGDVKEAIIKLMASEEGEKMRILAGKLKEMARRATEEGGSSYSDLNVFLEELKLTVKVPVKMNCKC
ncbi:hypothetical protein Ddye_003592 [Dipteronia dyeriana]|uniref:Glycosyltransferase n=1 Tax=Dipteronia dyeriana TaxID=168575 RepID=A0AAD9XTY2_9ROSI|nr:hypothetical protein Ddye_003592 [Dipteronia dyeriana]